MLYAITYRIRAESRNAAIERFLKTGGQPPAGVRMIGRWHDLASRWGVHVAETDDAAAMAKWALDWTDILDFETHTVFTDEQVGPLLASIGKS